MAYTIIDRTLNGKRSSGNRTKFVRRVKKTIKDQIRKQISEGNIDDLVTNKGRKVTVPKKDLSQPTFNPGKDGVKEGINTGNKKFIQGDRIDRPKGGAGGGGKGASKDGEGQDNFEFNLTHQEYLDMFFEDCELPHLRDTVITKTDKFAWKRAGFSTDGPAAQLNIERTMRFSKGRRIGLKRKGKKAKLLKLEIEEAHLAITLAEMKAEPSVSKQAIEGMELRLEEVRKQIKGIKRKLKAVPFIDDVDLRYNRHEKVPIPTSQAVMFCLMDVSGSMGQHEKEMAKRYFMLLYLFLTRNYERIEVVWIRHHSTAKVVDEEEFFKSRETGGTIVSTALEMMVNVINNGVENSSTGKREGPYSPKEWNIYGSQASDGDNWGEDSHVVVDMMKQNILPLCQYFTYIEIGDKSGRWDSDLWPHYETVARAYEHFQMKKVEDAADIYPVFQQLFRKSRRVEQHAKT